MTSGTDLVVVAWRVLDPDERESAYQQIADLRLCEQAGEESEAARYIAGLRLVATALGHSPSPTEYDDSRRLLEADGHALPPRSRLMRHFGSWKLAKEVLDLSKTETARRIEARFRFRKIGKVWRYPDKALAEAMARCVADVGRPSRVAEFDWWRERGCNSRKSTAMTACTSRARRRTGSAGRPRTPRCLRSATRPSESPSDWTRPAPR